jgi:hypothetical protein
VCKAILRSCREGSGVAAADRRFEC